MDEALKKNADNTHPYIVCIGDHSEFSSSVAICNKKVITSEIGHYVFSAVLTVLAISYGYDLSYHPMLKQVLEFIQEQVIGDHLPPSRKTSTAFSNLSRAIGCIQQQMEISEEITTAPTGDSEVEDDATQQYCDFN